MYDCALSCLQDCGSELQLDPEMQHEPASHISCFSVFRWHILSQQLTPNFIEREGTTNICPVTFRQCEQHDSLRYLMFTQLNWSSYTRMLKFGAFSM